MGMESVTGFSSGTERGDDEKEVRFYSAVNVL